MQSSAPKASMPDPYTSQSAAAGFLLPPIDTNSCETSILRSLRCGVVTYHAASYSHHLKDFFGTWFA